MKSKILVTRFLFKEEMDLLCNELSDHEIIINKKDGSLSRTELKHHLKDAAGVLSTLRNKLDKEILSEARNLKVISNFAVGFNNIDIEFARKKNIIVCNTPDVLTDATADLTMVLILTVARRIIEAENYLRSGLWKGWRPNLLLGTDLRNKTLGIIGLGRIGTAVAIRAKAFGMNLAYYSRTRKLDLEEKIGIRFLEFDELLRKSDFVSLHVPLTPETTTIIGKREFNLMRKTAFIINTSRGSVINEADLIQAIKNKDIAGAGLDVHVHEPIKMENELLKLKNVVLLPHIGSATIETRQKMAEIAVKNLILAIRGKEPLYRVV
ncbi:MAG: 2-hydroxyacid dehydrogenase [Candidatus Helarchaeota archaeon]